MNAPLNTFEKRIGQYVKLRDMIKEKEEAHKEELKPYREALDTLNNMLLGMLKETGQDSAKTVFGTAYRKVKRSATIADGDAFRRHVIGSEDWSLIDWRANVKAVEEFVKENHEAPPGVNYSTMFDVGVRRQNGNNEE